MADNQALERRRWEKRNTKWIIFAYCFVGFVSFIKIGARVKQWKWTIAGVVYALLFAVILFAFAENNPFFDSTNETIKTIRSMLFLGYYVATIVHCHLVKREYLRRLAAILQEEDNYPIVGIDNRPQQTNQINPAYNNSVPVTNPVPVAYPTASTMRPCPRCGAQVAGKFCGVCGTPMPSYNAVASASSYCPSCGAIASGKFCASCGALIANAGNPAPVTNPAPAAYSQPKSAQPQNSYASSPVNNSVIDINTCNESVFESLPGISAVSAKRLADFRKANNGFSSTEEFLSVAELKPHFAVQIRDRITCSPKGPTQATPSDRRLDL